MIRIKQLRGAESAIARFFPNMNARTCTTPLVLNNKVAFRVLSY